MIKLFLIFNIMLSFCNCFAEIKNNDAEKMYFVTASDSDYFEWLLDLIGSIHKVNFNELEEIAVFDLGLLDIQRNFLGLIQKVQVYDVEITHPDLLKHLSLPNGKNIRGLYAWKPVIMKQALEKFPYFLYIDGGSIVLNSLNGLFELIADQGYFLTTLGSLVSCPNVLTINPHCTQYIIEKLNLNSPESKKILGLPLILAGIQGISRKVFDQYIMPMYELTKDIKNFIDDGTCTSGWGSDMTLFSIYAHSLKLKLFEQSKPIPLRVNDTLKNFIVEPSYNFFSDANIIFQMRGRLHFSHYIKFYSNLTLRDFQELSTFIKT